MRNLSVDGARLWKSLMDMAEIGATPKGGSRRLALSDSDRQGRDLFVRWCREAGCSIRVDRMGNIFARRPGKDESRPPVMMGSHLDTQPSGGKFDGVYGVLAGLEVIRTLNDHGYESDSPVELAVWTNEEGARFAPSMIGSGVFAGTYSIEKGLACADVDGTTIGEELRRIGYAGDDPCGGRPIRAFFEAHIEQGPILEAEGKTIGVVTGAQGLRWYDVTVGGMDSHAGTTPMDRRRDAMAGAARMLVAAERIGKTTPGAVTTVGMLRVVPSSRNVVPGEVFFTVDARHPDGDTLAAMDAALRGSFAEIAQQADLKLAIETVTDTAPVVFDEGCVDAVRQAAEGSGYPCRDIVSGAGHDACFINEVAPTAMIFVPCKDGISHNEIESAAPDDLTAGCNVLLRVVLTAAEW
ncbi:MAG: Zn-dependent hydrolase [Rhodospirillales bacterium]|nr:MAG: Zn-dependent hydrolase [Rhodospirillales bacterium]